MKLTLFCIFFLAILFGNASAVGEDFANRCNLLKQADQGNLSYGEFIIGVGGDEIYVAYKDGRFMCGDMNKQPADAMSLVIDGILTESLNQSENFESVTKTKLKDRVSWWHSDADYHYLNLCVPTAGGEDQTTGMIWAMDNTDKLVSNCIKRGVDGTTYISDDQPGSTFIITPGEEYPTFQHFTYTGGVKTIKECTSIAKGGFEGEPTNNGSFCFNDDYTLVFRLEEGASDEDKQNCTSTKNPDKYVAKHGGYIRGEHHYLFGSDAVYRFARSVFDKKDTEGQHSATVKTIKYADFFQCSGEPRIVGPYRGKASTMWIIIGVILVIIVVLLALYCVFSMKRKNNANERSNKSGRSKKSPGRKSSSLKKVKSGSRKSSKKSGSRKSREKSGSGKGSRKSRKK